MITQILLGTDVGTTDSKVLVTTVSGEEILSVSAPSRWTTHSGRFTEMSADLLADTVIDLLERAVDTTQDRIGPVRVAGIGVTSMGEAGVLLAADGRPRFPIIAWFDPRGDEEIRRFPLDVREMFCGRTGLPLSPIATVAKLAWMRAQGADFAGTRWLNVAEYVVHRLGGVKATEMSLLARTGLLDQDSDMPWPAALAAVGAPAALIPDRVVAGTPLGRAGHAHGHVPAVLHGAVLTVAGHDHLVAAVGCGVVGADELFDSFGTAEALVQTVPGRLDFQARALLAEHGIDTVHHVLDNRRVLLGGTKAGLILRRTLRLLGADDAEGRDRLDHEVAVLNGRQDGPLTGIEVRGAANDDGTLLISATADDVTPAALWQATIDHAVDEAGLCLAHMVRAVGPAGATVVAGGWSRMRSVRVAKQRSLPNVRFSERTQAGAFGAALFAAHAVTRADQLAAAGDPAAVAIDRPTGPSPQFAAEFSGTPIRSALSIRRPQPQEITS